MRLFLLKVANKIMDGLIWFVRQWRIEFVCPHQREGKCDECVKDWHASGGW